MQLWYNYQKSKLSGTKTDIHIIPHCNISGFVVITRWVPRIDAYIPARRIQCIDHAHLTPPLEISIKGGKSCYAQQTPDCSHPPENLASLSSSSWVLAAYRAPISLSTTRKRSYWILSYLYLVAVCWRIEFPSVHWSGKTTSYRL